MQSTLTGTSRARIKKLNPRNNLPIVREGNLDLIDDESTRQGQRAETGVEKSEETEFHLQAALRSEQAAAAGQDVKKQEIPTRKAYPSQIAYTELYSLQYKQPATYVRFSSTVEDCVGCPYNMDEDDAQFLSFFNEKIKDRLRQCSQQQFEKIMFAIEEAASDDRISAANPEIPTEELDLGLDEPATAVNSDLLKEVYSHWSKRTRESALGKSFVVGLKGETGVETDDQDPYVCFRRRELRQTRKTRGRDAHSAEKLKKLRKELEEARQILTLIKQRETIKRDQLRIDKQLFESRANLRATKRALPEAYRTGDEDLLTTQKRKKTVDGTSRRSGQALRLVQNAESKSESSMMTLADLLAGREKEIQAQIELKIAQHQKWNENFVDLTTVPFAPVNVEALPEPAFCAATTQYLPTPPASIASGEGTTEADDKNETAAGSNHRLMSFRRRYGRGGRLFIDRRPIRQDDNICDFDDAEDDPSPTVYSFDPYDDASMKFRAALFRAAAPPARRPLDPATIVRPSVEVAVK